MNQQHWLFASMTVALLTGCETSGSAEHFVPNDSQVTASVEDVAVSDVGKDVITTDSSPSDSAGQDAVEADTNIDAFELTDVSESTDVGIVEDTATVPDTTDDSASPPEDVMAPEDVMPAEDTTTSPPKPELPMGPADELAKAGCNLIEGPVTSVIAVADMADAGQVIVTPTPNSAYAVTLPDTGVGYITLEVPEWAIIIGGFLNYANTLEVLDPDWVTEVILALSWNGACSDLGMTDQRLKYHAWGSFTVKLTGSPSEVMQLSFIKDEE